MIFTSTKKQPVIHKISNLMSQTKAFLIAAHDFSSLYKNIPHNKT